MSIMSLSDIKAKIRDIRIVKPVVADYPVADETSEEHPGCDCEGVCFLDSLPEVTAQAEDEDKDILGFDLDDDEDDDDDLDGRVRVMLGKVFPFRAHPTPLLALSARRARLIVEKTLTDLGIPTDVIPDPTFLLAMNGLVEIALTDSEDRYATQYALAIPLTRGARWRGEYLYAPKIGIKVGGTHISISEGLHSAEEVMSFMLCPFPGAGTLLPEL